MFNNCLGVFNLDLQSKYLDCYLADLTESQIGAGEMPPNGPAIKLVGVAERMKAVSSKSSSG
jgi:hypothetical protein